ncbi:hypothetical protein K466DRAFT_504065, partial [Polyporus arcularius HHB13444]
CQLGCDAVETARHIFVCCPFFDHLRCNAQADVVRETSEQLLMWPQHNTHYYLGTMPPLRLPENIHHELETTRLITRVVHAWHLTSIRLASRIWGEYKRRTTSRVTHPSPTFTLPPSLAYLLNS